MTKKLYLEQANLFSHKSVVTEVIDGEHKIVRLKETIFHPQGGGQKADRGSVGGNQVVHVAHNLDIVDHYVTDLNGLDIGSEVVLVVDQDYRKLNSIYHSAAHLLIGIIEEIYPSLKAISAHQWPNEANVVFDAKDNISFDVELANKAVLNALNRNFSVAILGDPYRERSLGIGYYPSIPCGGTHVKALSEISKLEITRAKIKKQKLKVSYIAS